MMTLKHVMVLQHLLGKVIDVTLMTDRNPDESRNVLADLLAVKQRLVALDNASSLEFFHSFHHRRDGKLDRLSDIRKAGSPVILKNKKYF